MALSPLPPSSTASSNETIWSGSPFGTTFAPLFTTTDHHHHRPPPETTRDHSRPLPGSTWRPPSADLDQHSHTFCTFYFFDFSALGAPFGHHRAPTRPARGAKRAPGTLKRRRGGSSSSTRRQVKVNELRGSGSRNRTSASSGARAFSKHAAKNLK